MEAKSYNTGRQVGSGNQLVNAMSQLQEDATSQYQGQNMILTSHLLPKVTTAMYPTNGRQRTNTKAVDIATLVTVDALSDFTNDLFFVIPEESPVPAIHVFRRKDDGKNYFQGFVRTAEAMNDVGKYRASRLVSAVIDFRSDTRPGGNFDISGQFNAITMPYLPPDFQSSDHNQLLKFKDTPADVRTNVPILDGITYLKGLPEENPLLIRAELAGEYNYGTAPEADFWRPRNYVATSESVLVFTDKDVGQPGIDVRSSSATQPGIPQFTVYGDAVERLPSLCMYRVEYRLEMADMVSTDFDIIVARVYMRYGTTSQYIELNMQFVNQGGGAGADTSTFKSSDFYAFSAIEKVEIVMTNDQSIVIRSQQLSLTARFASSQSSDRQATVISVRGVPNGVTYSIAGRLNYEFIPGTQLKPDILPEHNCCTQTDLLAALRVQEYLADSVGVSHVMTCAEYSSFVGEVSTHFFDRSRHSRYAFLGPIMPLLRTAFSYFPKVLAASQAATDLGRDLHAVMRNHTKKRKAMLGLANMPARGIFANLAKKTFAPAAEEAVIPVAQSVRSADTQFQVTRKFVTVDENDQPETGQLTVSSQPMNKESYTVLKVGEVHVHYQNYDFGETYVSDDDIRAKFENSAPDTQQALETYRDQEPLRTLAWMAQRKQMDDIYLTSDLEGVAGGSTGFTMEAIWFGYSEDYAYTGSSSPYTQWLPSYDLGPGLEAKAKLSRVALKTLAAQLDDAQKLGCTIPQAFDGGDMPSQVALESSSWFMEQLFGKSDGQSLKTRIVTETKVEYRDSPALVERVKMLEEALAKAQKVSSSGKDKSEPASEKDFFRQSDAPKTAGALVVRGYPKLNVPMEGAEEINRLLDMLDNEELPDDIPEALEDYIFMYPELNTTSVWKMVQVMRGEVDWPKTVSGCKGIMSAFKAFVDKLLPMPDDAVVLDEGLAQSKNIGDFVKQFGIKPALPGWVNKDEYNTALGFAGQDKAYKNGKVTSDDYQKLVNNRSSTRTRKRRTEKEKQERVGRGDRQPRAMQRQQPVNPYRPASFGQEDFPSLQEESKQQEHHAPVKQTPFGGGPSVTTAGLMKKLSGHVPKYLSYE